MLIGLVHGGAATVLTPGTQQASASMCHNPSRTGHGPAQQQAWSGAPLPRHGCHLTGTMSSICGQQPPHISAHAHACHACKRRNDMLYGQASTDRKDPLSYASRRASGTSSARRHPPIIWSCACDIQLTATMPARRACGREHCHGRAARLEDHAHALGGQRERGRGHQQRLHDRLVQHIAHRALAHVDARRRLALRGAGLETGAPTATRPPGRGRLNGAPQAAGHSPAKSSVNFMRPVHSCSPPRPCPPP